jgi:acetoin utilization deacetylase AcuC-like enzyme
MPKFATYLHPHTRHTSKPGDQIQFVGHSLPYFSRVRQGLEKALSDYPVLPVRKAEYEEYLRVHTEEYLQKLTLMASGEYPEEPPALSIECVGLEYCLPGYLYGLGGMLEAVDRMEKGTLERAYCFSLGGHHAYADWGHGYCLLNPMAATARYAQDHGFERVLITDWDHHHGDGTQSIFANDPGVYCISIHSAADIYMAKACGLKYGTTTMAEEVGHCNIPVLDQIFDDDFFESVGLGGRFYRACESLPAFRSALERIPWPPDLIFIFSGYDAHKDDCGKGITDWVNEDYRLLTQYVLELAQRSSSPVLSVHGGGYQLPVTISAAISHVEILASYQ